MEKTSAQPLSDAQAASMLAALGSEVRLRLYRLLLRAGLDGLSVSSIQRATAIAPSTLGHHISALVGTGLISQQRVGRELICRAEYADVYRLSAFLLAECCADQACAPSTTPATKATPPAVTTQQEHAMA